MRLTAVRGAIARVPGRKLARMRRLNFQAARAVRPMRQEAKRQTTETRSERMYYPFPNGGLALYILY